MSRSTRPRLKITPWLCLESALWQVLAIGFLQLEVLAGGAVGGAYSDSADVRGLDLKCVITNAIHIERLSQLKNGTEYYPGEGGCLRGNSPAIGVDARFLWGGTRTHQDETGSNGFRA